MTTDSVPAHNRAALIEWFYNEIESDRGWAEQAIDKLIESDALSSLLATARADGLNDVLAVIPSCTTLDSLAASIRLAIELNRTVVPLTTEEKK